MADKYVPPELLVDGFHCPHCGTFSHQEWFRAISVASKPSGGGEQRELDRDFTVSICYRCNRFGIWQNDRLLYPPTHVAPLPLEDMPADVKEDYEEARSIYSLSPKGSAALLRLAVQKLVVALDEDGKDLNKNIGNLVKKGLPIQVQQALDTVRVIGNNAVHPGQIDINDNPKIALGLFGFVNVIVEQMITQPKKIEELYTSALPEGAKDQIEARDKPE